MDAAIEFGKIQRERQIGKPTGEIDVFSFPKEWGKSFPIRELRIVLSGDAERTRAVIRYVG